MPKLKLFHSIFIPNQGFVVQYPNSIGFVEKLEEATFFSSKKLADGVVADYDMVTEGCEIKDVNVLIVDETQKVESRLFLNMQVEGQALELFAIALPASRIEAFAAANSAVTLLRTMFASLG
jgi:hypothetical protein